MHDDGTFCLRICDKCQWGCQRFWKRRTSGICCLYHRWWTGIVFPGRFGIFDQRHHSGDMWACSKSQRWWCCRNCTIYEYLCCRRYQSPQPQSQRSAWRKYKGKNSVQQYWDGLCNTDSWYTYLWPYSFGTSQQQRSWKDRIMLRTWFPCGDWISAERKQVQQRRCVHNLRTSK